MDKKKLYDFLNENKIPYPKIYYYSSNNFKIRKIINNLINENKCFVVKPTNLSEKLNCIVYKNGINMLNGNTVDLDIFNDYKINDNILTESLTLKMNKPGIIVQESLHVSDIINEWKIFCCWGHVIFAMWRQNHLYDIGLIDSEFNFKSCLPFFDTPKLPKFKNEIYTIAKKLSRSYPFIRIDFLFNYDKFVVNEIEFCPSGFYGNQNEKMLMECIKKGYNINSNNLDYLLEIKSYLYFILNRFNCLLI